MNLIDTHSHLTFKPLSGDLDAVLQRSTDAGVTGWITVGTDDQENRKVVELANQHDNMYAAIGIHPHDAKDVTDQIIENLRTLAENKKVVAIGETGLDFHYNFSPPEIQKKVFTQHLELALDLDMPAIIHSREAFDETIEILKQFGSNIRRIVFHCFGGDADQAKTILDLGYYISFTGVVTFKNAKSVRQAAEITPIDKMMLETDCPYMSPEPMRNQKINEPALMIHTAEFLANLKQMSMHDFAQKVTATSKTFFDLK